MSKQQALLNVIKAWEELPTGNYSPMQIETWLKDSMWHAVNDAREALNLVRSDGGR